MLHDADTVVQAVGAKIVCELVDTDFAARINIVDYLLSPGYQRTVTSDVTGLLDTDVGEMEIRQVLSQPKQERQRRFSLVLVVVGLVAIVAVVIGGIVIGGGLLGLEAANGLMKQGMDVTVLHLMDSLMERQLDEVAAAVAYRPADWGTLTSASEGPVHPVELCRVLQEFLAGASLRRAPGRRHRASAAGQ